MPEAAMHEHDLTPPRKDEIRRSRQVSTMQPESVAQAMRQASDNHLRLGRLALDRRHERGASGLALICHRGIAE